MVLSDSRPRARFPKPLLSLMPVEPGDTDGQCDFQRHCHAVIALWVVLTAVHSTGACAAQGFELLCVAAIHVAGYPTTCDLVQDWWRLHQARRQARAQIEHRKPNEKSRLESPYIPAFSAGFAGCAPAPSRSHLARIKVRPLSSALATAFGERDWL